MPGTTLKITDGYLPQNKIKEPISKLLTVRKILKNKNKKITEFERL